MAMENFRLLAALIAAHPDRKVVGRTRLQKEVKLLQSLGFPTDYTYMIHFYGPYSEGLFSDIGLLEGMGYISEEECSSHDGKPYYIISAKPEAESLLVEQFNDAINIMAGTENIPLELAATYNAFRDGGGGHDDAVARVRRKKGAKCDNGNLDKALKLLEQLGLSAS